jgi:hypothetical protein
MRAINLALRTAVVAVTFLQGPSRAADNSPTAVCPEDFYNATAAVLSTCIQDLQKRIKDLEQARLSTAAATKRNASAGYVDTNGNFVPWDQNSHVVQTPTKEPDGGFKFEFPQLDKKPIVLAGPYSGPYYYPFPTGPIPSHTIVYNLTESSFSVQVRDHQDSLVNGGFWFILLPQ